MLLIISVILVVRFLTELTNIFLDLGLQAQDFVSKLSQTVGFLFLGMALSLHYPSYFF